MNLLTAAIQLAIALFMSFAPLPIKWPFLTPGLNGFIVQFFKLPGGTTSTCPANIKFGFLFPNLAYKFFTGFVLLFLNSKILHLKPRDDNFFDKNFVIPASTGVIEGYLISSLAHC